MFLVSDLKMFLELCDKANVESFDIDAAPRGAVFLTGSGPRPYTATLETGSFNVVLHRFLANRNPNEPAYGAPSMLTWTTLGKP